MNTVKKRLIEFLSYLNISQKKFEGTVGLSNGFVNNIGDSIRKKSIEKVSSIYPELNITWLLTGSGEMLKTDLPKIDTSANEQSVPYFLYKDLLDRNERLARENERLTELLNKNGIDYKKAI